MFNYILFLYIWELINYNINIFSADYECTQEDAQVIEYMQRKHMEDLLVQIDDAWVNRDDMDCIFYDHMQVNGSVSTAFKLIN